MRVEETTIPGCYQLFPQIKTDARGRFVKTFHKDVFAEHGLVTEFAEEYYSVSHKGVLRGMHFQMPPHEHYKLVYCLDGKVLDAIVDLRAGSPTYRQAATIELSAESGNMLYIAPGVAHGFYALTDDVVMQYKVTSMYAADNDAGIRWDSAGIDWPDAAPLVSERDVGFPPLAEFESPFVYADKAGERETMKIALVTGSTGFIGSHLVNGLLDAGWQVHVVIRKPLGRSLWDPARVKVHHHDGSTESLVSMVREARPDVVFHLASLFLSSHRVEDVVPLMQSNVQFSAQLIEAMHQSNCNRLVDTGTSWQHYQGKEYSPVNLYAATKQAFGAILQYYVEACGLRAITLELFDTYGPGDTRRKLIHLLEDAARTQQTLSMSPGEQKIDLVHVDDVVRAYLVASERLLADRVRGHECYAVSSGRPVRLKELVAILEHVRGVTVPVQWGGRDYREREVMEPWRGGKPLPGWSPQISLESGLGGDACCS